MRNRNIFLIGLSQNIQNVYARVTTVRETLHEPHFKMKYRLTAVGIEPARFGLLVQRSTN